MSNDNDKKSFSKTLNLPKTEFPIRPKAEETETKILKLWEEINVYRQSLEIREGNETFTLHDGPPYSNGKIHMGHVLNKVLKDVFCRSRRMEGKQSFFQPGWDCHGLPIELKVTQELGWDKNPENIDPEILKKKCREFSEHWIDRQMADFKRLGVMADWENYYSTMSPEYESGVLEVFSKFVAQGLIERREKTVPWCASCHTTLAAVEIEYKDRKDPSCFVLFDLDEQNSQKYFSDLKHEQPELKVSMLAWTTTPWTLPLNRALVLKPKTEYSVVKFDESKAFVVASKLVDQVCKTVGVEPTVIAQVDSSTLTGLEACHPVDLERKVPVVFDQMVSLDDGTAVVHCAPGCGPEDYLIALREKIEVFSPLTPDGKYSADVMPKELEGMPITEGQWWTLKFLKERGNLLFKGNINHSYPHCWRCKNGLMFRATKQWFCNLDSGQTKDKLIENLDKIQFIPDWGKNRLDGFIKSRSEWCLSRQRHWGVPIPALKCKKCDEGFISEELVAEFAKLVAKHGIAHWDTVTVDDVKNFAKVPDSGCSCAKSDWIKEGDIMDVWFESGASFWSVAKKDKRASLKGDKAQELPISLYLEGSDQHRGWFQSSFSCSVITTGSPSMEAILTHGYIVDEKREKMSKSLGNTVNAEDLLKKHGADVLRLWVCSESFQNDMPISDKMVDTVAGIFRKIRNTFRFMVSNLYDYDGQVPGNAEVDADGQAAVPNFRIPHEDQFSPDKPSELARSNITLMASDRYILGKLLKVSRKIRQAYKDYDLTTVFSTLSNFCNNDLSAGYLDIAKDRLYVEKADGNARRSAQATVYHVLDYLNHMISPVLPFLTEELSDIYNSEKDSSIHTHYFLSDGYLERLVGALDKKMCSISERFSSDSESGECTQECEKFWPLADKMRKAVLKSIEGLREQGQIKHSLEASVTVFVEPKNEAGSTVCQGLHAIDEKFEGSVKFLEDFLIVSKIEITHSPDGLDSTELDWLHVKVDNAPGTKCPRCWKWEEKDADALCARCKDVLGEK